MNNLLFLLFFFFFLGGIGTLDELPIAPRDRELMMMSINILKALCGKKTVDTHNYLSDNIADQANLSKWKTTQMLLCVVISL